MKTTRKNGLSPLSFLKSLSWFPKGMSWFLTLICLPLFTGCSYFRVTGLDADNASAYAEKIREFNQAKKYIILHAGDATLHLQQAVMDEASLELRGVTTNLLPEHIYKREAKPDKTYRYHRARQNPLNEVHIYLKPGVQVALGENVSIPLQSVERIASTKPDVGTTAGYAVLGSLGVGVLILAIVFLFKSSCPFLYVNDGENLVFQGELYPGSIIENAQRPDYLPLPLLNEREGYYTLEIANELLEIQHTDQAILQVVDHPAGSKVYASPEGELFTVNTPQAPRYALADGKHDITRLLAGADSDSWSFTTPLRESDGKRSVELEFDGAGPGGTAKLLLTLKNTLWLDYVVGTFYRKFGDYYATFQRDQQDVTYEEAFRWRSGQSMPLSVYMATENGWELQYQIPAVGPLAYRELVVPLRVGKKADGPLRLRLETGLMFWELDRVALDTSAPLPLEVRTVYPESAMDQNNRDVADLLRDRDGEYLTQREAGNAVSISYRSPERRGENRTLFLKSTGFYTYIRDYTGMPDFAELKKFREPGHFTKFAESEYNNLVDGLIARQAEIAGSHGN